MITERLNKLNIRFSEHIPDGFIGLVQKFIVAADEHERTPLSILSQIHDTLKHRGGLWVVEDEHFNKFGYAFAQIMPNEYGTTTCFVHEVFLERCDVTIQEIELHIAAWGKINGATEMAFCTRRNPDAFKKILMPGWKIDSVILKRSLEV